MSVLTHTRDFAHRRAPSSQPGSFRRLVRSFLQWRQRRAEEDIAVRLGLTGGHITDEIERRIYAHLTRSSGFRG
jgi:hypothetical protein